MKIYRILYIALFSFAFISCDRDELLDIKPYGQEIPETVEDFRLLIDYRGSNFNDKGREPLYDIDLLMGDEIKIPDDFASKYIDFLGNTRYFDALTWSENFGGPEDDDNDWETIYNQIYIANIIIESMNDASITGDDNLREQIKAEAKIHRAVAHFACVNLYSRQYTEANAAAELGIPIKDNSATGPNAKNPRASVKEVYDFVINDLNEAINSGALEESVPVYNWRASKVSAYAILARVYLQIGDYSKALDSANNCLSIYNTLSNYNVTRAIQSYDNKELILVKRRVGSYPINGFVNDELQNLYEVNDLRPEVRFGIDYRYGTGGYVFTSQSYVGPSVGEIYLIRAECYARSGEFQLAIDDLNTLRENRYVTGTFVPLTTTEIPDGPSALSFVKTERRRELAGNGLRLFDLKRYNALDDANISITRVIDGETTVLEANSNRWIVPIARNIFNLAPEIEQSPR